MIFTETKLSGVTIIDLEKRGDERGFFARSWCQEEFQDQQLFSKVVQQNVSFSKFKGTLRGMHYQVAPYAETKIIRCPRGAVFDVVIDLRPDSETFKQWFGIELSADNYKMIYIPQGFAHGYQTLTDDTEVTYLVSAFYTPKAERGVRYNDPAVLIQWPLPVTTISDKDMNWPDIK